MTPDGRFAVFASAPVADAATPKLGHLGDLPLRLRRGGAATNAPPARTTLAPAKNGHDALAVRPQPHRTTGGSSSPPPKASSSATPTKSSTPTSGTGGIEVGQDLDRPQLLRLEAALGQRRRRRRLLLHPGRARPRGRKRRRREDLRRPRRRRLPAGQREARPAPPPTSATARARRSRRPRTSTRSPAPAQQERQRRRAGKPKCKKGFVKKHGKCVKKHRSPNGTTASTGREAMAEPTTSKERPRMSTQSPAARSRRPVVARGARLRRLAGCDRDLAFRRRPSPKSASSKSRTNNTEAGAHPDINTSFTLLNAGRTGSRENDRSEVAGGGLRQPARRCRAAAASTSR